MLKQFYDSLDIDECNTENGGCSHTCINFVGGHYCQCHKGYTLQEDKLTCGGKCYMQNLLFCFRVKGGNTFYTKTLKILAGIK